MSVGDKVPLPEIPELYERIQAAWADHHFHMSNENDWKWLDRISQHGQAHLYLTKRHLEVATPIVGRREAIVSLNRANRPKNLVRLRQLFEELRNIASPYYGKGHGYTGLGVKITFVRTDLERFERGGYFWDKHVQEVLDLIRFLPEELGHKQLRDRLERDYADLLAATALNLEPPR